MAHAIRIGFAQRPASIGSKLVVFKGYNPQSTLMKQDLAPVAAGVSVLSGNVLQKKKNSTTSIYEFVLAGASGAVGIPSIALDDDTTLLNGGINGPSAFDVANTKLTALPVDGDYELGTSRFTAGTYTLGVYITYDTANPGNVKPGVLGTDPIIGIVSGFVDSPVNIYPNDNTAAPVVTVSGSPPSQTVTVVSNVIRFKTLWLPPSA